MLITLLLCIPLDKICFMGYSDLAIVFPYPIFNSHVREGAINISTGGPYFLGGGVSLFSPFLGGGGVLYNLIVFRGVYSNLATFRGGSSSSQLHSSGGLESDQHLIIF